MPRSVRLDEESEAWVELEARRTRTTRSAVIRAALKRAAASEGAVATPYATIADLIGVFASKTGSLSERTGARYARMLAERRR